jgi:progressive ankylosis protein
VPESNTASSPAPSPLSVREIMASWIPLALSFELMVAEGPVLQGSIGRLPHSELHLAAWGLTMALAMLVESPVIMLLATSIALVRNPSSYRALRQFMLTINSICTILAALVAFTPALDWIAGRIMGQPQALIEASRPALQIMVLFTAAVGWRRFYQGILIRHGHGRVVTLGTLLRILGTLLAAVLLATGGKLPGVQVAAYGIMIGLLIEAVVTTLFCAPIIRNVVNRQPEQERSITQREILRFHAPLAATTLLSLLLQPVMGAALAKLPHPETTLATWPVVFMILLILRGFGFTLQEVTVARVKEDVNSEKPLLRFALQVGWITSAAAVLLALTPLLDFYLGTILRLPPHLWDYARTGVLWGALTPVLSAFSAWARGTLVAQNRTPIVYRAMLVSMVALGASLSIALLFRLPGMISASVAFTLSLAGECLYLYFYRNLPEPIQKPKPATP